MKKLSKKLVSVVLVLVTVFTTLAATATTAFAANYSTSYSSYNEPESNDYAYWNGKKVVKGSGTTTNEIKWMQAALNYCIAKKGLNASKLDVDGSFGPASKKATTAFQKKYGLTQDGSFGSKTISKMKSVLNPTQTSTNMIWPLANGAGTVSSKAGTVRSYETHAGTDIAASAGTSILAIANGTVKDVGYNSARGYYITIEHGDYLSVYQHMKSASKVKKGATVKKGQLIGYVGSTGSSSGNHLHFEIALTSSLSKTGSITNYLYNDIKNKKKPTYYSISKGSKNGSYYKLNMTKV